MAPPIVPPPPEGGMSFFLSWGIIEWALTAIGTGAVGIGFWVWGLGGKVDAMAVKIVELEGKVDMIEAEVDKKHAENQLASARLKAELLAHISDLPSRNFIESQMTALTHRIDQLMQARMGPRND